MSISGERHKTNKSKSHNICERCEKETNARTCSWFNTEMICIDCTDKEKKHDLYSLAKAIENEHVKAGDLNFKGIGLPYSLVQNGHTHMSYEEEENYRKMLEEKER